MPVEFQLFALAQSELIAPVDIFTLMMRSLISILYGGGKQPPPRLLCVLSLT
jgi:hypothetical protein